MTVVISSMVMLALFSFTTIISRVYTESKIKNEQQLIISNVKYYLKGQLTLAVDIKSTGDATYDKIEFKNNVILKNDANVFSDSVYGDQAITATVKGFGSLLNFVITVEDATGKATSQEFTLKMRNKINIDIPDQTTILYYKQ